jgi:hypothetical protein
MYILWSRCLLIAYTQCMRERSVAAKTLDLHVGFGVLTTVVMKMITVCWVIPCNSAYCLLIYICSIYPILSAAPWLRYLLNLHQKLVSKGLSECKALPGA